MIALIIFGTIEVLAATALCTAFLIHRDQVQRFRALRDRALRDLCKYPQQQQPKDIRTRANEEIDFQDTLQAMRSRRD